jgi:hypothetical protein
MYLRANWNGSFTRHFDKIADLVCDGASKGKVTPLITSAKSVPANAQHVNLERLFNAGRIPRIYISFLRNEDPSRRQTDQAIISKLRVIFQDPSVNFSVTSSKPDRLLICASYSKGTAKRPPSSPNSNMPSAA